MDPLCECYFDADVGWPIYELADPQPLKLILHPGCNVIDYLQLRQGTRINDRLNMTGIGHCPVASEQKPDIACKNYRFGSEYIAL